MNDNEDRSLDIRIIAGDLDAMNQGFASVTAEIPEMGKSEVKFISDDGEALDRTSSALVNLENIGFANGNHFSVVPSVSH